MGNSPRIQDDHLRGPLALVFAPDGNLITSNGDAVNPDPTQPSEIVEFTINRPCDVVVSAHVSPRDLKPAFLAAIAASAFNRSRVDRASRSSRVTITTVASVGLVSSKRRSSARSGLAPLAIGLRSGILGAPARATQAASPLLFGLLMDRMGIGVLAISAGRRAGAGIIMALAPGTREYTKAIVAAQMA